MKNLITTLIIYIIQSMNGFCQETFLFKDNNLIFVFKNGNQVIKIISDNNSITNKYIYSISDTIVDTLLYDKTCINHYLDQKNKTFSFIVNPPTGDFQILQSINYLTGKRVHTKVLNHKCYSIYKNSLLIEENKGPQLKLLDPYNNIIKTNIFIPDLTENEKLAEVTISEISSKLLLKIGLQDDEGTGYSNCKFIIFDLANNQYYHMTPNREIQEYIDFDYFVRYSDIIQQNFFCNNNYYLDNNFNLKSRIVKRVLNSYDFAGYFFNNDTIISNFYFTSTDSSTFSGYAEVIAPITIKLSTELSLNKIFENELLYSDELAHMNMYDLKILKNMIYAKHNYKFDDEYYQAYFNTFVFYSDESMRKSRLPDVTHLLTPADKQNLALINETMEKIK